MLHKDVALKDPFIIANTGRVIPVRAIHEIDTSTLEERYITVHYDDDKKEVIDGVQAIEAMMLIKPSALEGRTLKWARQAWLLHNTVGHSYLAFLSLAALLMRPVFPNIAKAVVRHGVYVHDITVPKPL